MTTREQARAIIAPVVLAHAGESRRQIRQALRAARAATPFAHTRGYLYSVWREEVAIALRDRSRRGRRKPLASGDVMPAMREWAVTHGLVEVRAVLDVDDAESLAVSGGANPELTLEP
jgi:hypothetical protein